jgi:hydroxymethylbilane synthase
MPQSLIKIGTRESQLAIWQAEKVRELLQQNGYQSELVFIKSEGDVDLVTPLYAMGVQGVFTRSLDIALLNHQIDIAVHSMKDVPVQLPQEIVQAAVLRRASYKDILVMRSKNISKEIPENAVIATSSIRRKAQWLHRFPDHQIENLRGNVNTRLRKVAESNWHGAIFAAAGLERIGLRPSNSIDLDWMLPAPAQGAIVIVARKNDETILNACKFLNDDTTSIAVKIERDFLSALMGGCSTPISALAIVENKEIIFTGNIVLPDGTKKAEIKKIFSLADVDTAGKVAATAILKNGGDEIIQQLQQIKS